ncbi:MAG: MnhB domain-containing protein [Dehalococcoidia bacterium]
MTSLILQTTTRLLISLLLVVAVFFFARGHNAPGGGFIAGLGAVTAVLLYAFAFGSDAAVRFLRVDPRQLAGAGLLVALGSGLLAPLSGETYLTGWWTSLPLPGRADLKLGTPVLFDLGVAMVVLGVGVSILTSLASEARDG